MSTEVSEFDYMNIKETAERMGIDRRTLAESIKAGTPFPHHHFMSLIAIPKLQYEQYVRGEWTPVHCDKCHKSQATIKPLRTVVD